MSSSVVLPMLKRVAFNYDLSEVDETPNDYTMLASTLDMDDYFSLKTMLLRLKRLCVRRNQAHALIRHGMKLMENNSTDGNSIIPMPDHSYVVFQYDCSTVCVLTLLVSNTDFQVEIPLIDCHGAYLSDKVKAECPHYHNMTGVLCDMKTMYNFLEAYFADIIVQPYSDEEVVCELMEFIYDYSNMEEI